MLTTIPRCSACAAACSRIGRWPRRGRSAGGFIWKLPALYARAGAIGGATYPLINAATLSLLAGKREQSKDLARKLVAQIRAGGDDLETPYYRAATHAEALARCLATSRRAKKALAGAMALAPKAYEDHASTLRQFGLILTALGERQAPGSIPGRPPRSLHFAGHMSLSHRNARARKRIAAVIRAERIGFGYGALAAGADILVAEALLEAGAELHLVLPNAKERFRAFSVAGFGKDWALRYDRILHRATSIRCIAGAPEPVFPQAIQLAAEVAMGSAVMQAGMLMTGRRCSLVIVDRPASTARAGKG